MATMPLHEQLKNKIGDLMKTGQLADGTLLPDTKTLSEKLGVSHATSKMAYKLLIDEGCVVHLKGRSYRVALNCIAFKEP
ncbi:winged helix-turn-helix domain-containing protein [Pedobacter sp. P351]|uniref:winged helix-turn-helix domain-containing protein n=1 Tax=Pedobacter superstes TaxID=3133441 RepID=UPI0030971E74